MLPCPVTQWLGSPRRGPARRIVSLVPSLTEAVFMLAAGAKLVGRTEWCVRPPGKVDSIPALGGTKNPDVARIIDLRPDAVLASREENTRHRVLDIADHVPVWLASPRGPEDVPDLWRELGAITGREAAGERLARRVAATLEEVQGWSRRIQGGARFLYLVWKHPWIAAGPDTYISRLLETSGLRNALPPGPERFPKLDDAALLGDGIDVYLFSTEPFAFELPRDLGPLWVAGAGDSEGWLRIREGRLGGMVDAQPLSWYPSLAEKGLAYARELRRRIDALRGR